MITYRDAARTDLPAVDALFRRSFADTFGHLYAPADLAAFFDQFTPAAWADEFARLRFRLAERDGRLLGFAKLGPVELPVAPAGPARELWQLYLADEAKGAGVADALLGWAIETARGEGGRAVPVRLRRQPPRQALLRPPRLRGCRALHVQGGGA